MTSETADGVRFPSLAALKSAHGDLLLRRRADGESSDLLEAASAFLRQAQATGALLEDDEARSTAQGLLTYWSNFLHRAGREPPSAVLSDFDASRAPAIADELCPYVGLRAFDENDSGRFFGRRQMIRDLLQHLRWNRLLVVVGPSGSGKSSLVRAGLLPALRDGALPASETWRHLRPIVPGSDPLANIVRLFVPRTQHEDGTEENAVGDAAAAGARAVPGAGSPAFWEKPRRLTQLVNDSGVAPALVVVDQFEEVFTLVEDDRARQLFIDNLLALADAPGPRHTVILTMRSDFESFVARAPELQDRFSTARVQVLPLNAAEMREAIEAPATAVGLKFEPGVVDRLLQDILGEPAGLPLLQFTLLKLWEARERNRVTLEAYQRVGGGREALSRSADALYSSLIPEDQVTARRTLMRMVRPGDGLEVTSNRVRLGALHESREDPSRVDRVLDRLVRAHLLRVTPGATPSDTQIEVAHEALVRNWPKLVEWLEAERAAIATRRRLEARADEWVRLGAGDAGLLDEVPLREAERWLDSTEAAYLGYDPALRALVARSREALEAQERKKEAVRQRELEQARALALSERLRAESESRRAEETARARRRQGVLAAALLVLAASLVGLLAYGLNTAIQTANQANLTRQTEETLRIAAETNEREARLQQSRAEQERERAEQERERAEQARQEAERQETLARAGRLEAQAQQQMSEGRPQLSLLLAAEALQLAATSGDAGIVDATRALTQTLGRSISGLGGLGLAGHSQAVTAVALSPDGRHLLSGGADKTLLLWDLAGPAPAAFPLRGVASPITRVAISPAGSRRWLVAACDDGTVYAWNLANPAGAPSVLSGHAAPITTLAISEDGARLATGSEDATIRIWNLAGDDPAAGVRVLRQSGGSGPLRGIRALALSPGGRWVLSAGDDGTPRLWDLNDRDPIQPMYAFGRGRPLRAAAFSPNGRWLAVGGDDERIDLWRFTEASGFAGSSPVPLTRRAKAIGALAFSADSRWLISGHGDSTARLWDVGERNPADNSVDLTGHTAPILTLATSERWLVTGSEDGTARLWDLRAESPAASGRVLGGHEAPVRAAAIDAPGDVIVTGSADTSTRIWQRAALETSPSASLPSDPAELVELVCRTAGRNMTPQEWQAFFAGQKYRKTCPNLP